MSKKSARNRGFFNPRKKNAKQLRHEREVAGDYDEESEAITNVATTANDAADAFANFGLMLGAMHRTHMEQIGEQIAEGLRAGLLGLDEVTDFWNHRFMSADEILQREFVSWERHLELDAFRLKKITYEQVPSLISPAGFVEFENIPEPRSPYALTHVPGSVYRAGPNEWYCESGTTRDAQKGSGYMVTRAFVPELVQMRWFCTCIRFKQFMYSDEPYCKHIHAVRAFTREDRVYDWLDMPDFHDIAAWFVWCEDFGFMDKSDFSPDELFEIIPNLESTMEVIRKVNAGKF